MASEAVEDKKSEEEAPVEEIEALKPPEKEGTIEQTENEELGHGKSEISEKEREEDVEGEVEAEGKGEGEAETEVDSLGKGESKSELEEKNVEDDKEIKDESEGEGEGTEEARELSKEKDKKEKKRGRKKAGEKKMDSTPSLKEPVTPVSDRPTRERKTVERYSVASPAKSGRSSAGKGLSIEKGRGTPLKDIPNVAFKLSKRKADENLQVLHTILFGKKAKVHYLKRNINQFSGYVWVETEKEKQRFKIKEKLDKCVKEKLVDFCDVLNIQINKAAIKKEELSAKLLEFLESPHATTDVILSDKEQKAQKRKRKFTPNKAVESAETSIETSGKKQKSHSGKSKKNVPKDEEEDYVDNKVEPSDEKSSSSEDYGNDTQQNEESDKEESKSEDEKSPKQMLSPKVATPKERATSTKKQESAKIVKDATRSKEKTSLSRKRKGDPDQASGLTSKSKASKKQKIDEPKPKKEKPKSKDHSTKALAMVAKDQGKGKSSKKSKVEPSKEQMHAVVVNILKDVDFNTATLSDILRQLGSHFGVDLMHRKAEVKDIITEVISNMSDEEEGDEAEENAGVDGDSEKDDDDA